jgi:hypothetical protein
MHQSHLFDSNSTSQVNQGRVRDLGRGSRLKSKLQSPHTHIYSSKNLRIIKCNINGLNTPDKKLKLDQILEIVDKHHMEVIALQETKLSEKRQCREWLSTVIFTLSEKDNLC